MVRIDKILIIRAPCFKLRFDSGEEYWINMRVQLGEELFNTWFKEIDAFYHVKNESHRLKWFNGFDQGAGNLLTIARKQLEYESGEPSPVLTAADAGIDESIIVQGFICEICWSHHIGNDVYPSKFFREKVLLDNFMHRHGPKVDTLPVELLLVPKDGAKAAFIVPKELTDDIPSITLHSRQSEGMIPVWIYGDFQKLRDDPNSEVGKRWLYRQERNKRKGIME